MKSTVSDLAILGGASAFGTDVHVGKPNVGNQKRLLERIQDIVERRYFTNGGIYEADLEQRIAETAGVRHCIAVCNGTVALEIVYRASGLQGEVIVPSFTFVATAHALQWLGITPVFCDIDPSTFTIDPDRIEELITPRTTGIVGVHLWGRTCNVERLSELAARHRIRLIFDAAHALGCTRGGARVGSFGDVEVFSFHATKFVNSFEGGAVVTNDDRIADRVRVMRNFGFVDYDDVRHIGTNGKMPEVSAAMGLTSLESMPEFITVNRRNYDLYEQELAGVAGVAVLPYDQRETPNYQYVVVDIDESVCGLTRDQLHALLHAERVLARRYFYPGCHRMEPYRTLFPDVGERLPVTNRIAGRVLCLPTGTGVDEHAIRTICRIIGFAVEHAPSIRDRLHTRSTTVVPSSAPKPAVPF